MGGTRRARMRKKKKLPEGHLEDLFARQIADEGIITPHRRFKFHNGRRWEFDFAWPGVLGGSFFHSLAFEVEGGSWIRGRHTTGVGFEKDCRKYAAANEHGWMVLRATSGMVNDGTAIRLLKRVILRPDHLPVDSAGLCHPLSEDSTGSVTTAASTSTRRNRGSGITRCAGKGNSRASRRPTRRPPRRRRGPNRARGSLAGV